MTAFKDSPRLPTIDLSLFDLGDPWRDHVAAQIDWAAAEFGVFRIIGHGVERGVLDSLLASSRRYLAQDGAGEDRHDLVFDETSLADGAPLPSTRTGSQRDVWAQWPGFRDGLRDYMTALTGLGHRLMTSFARGLRLGDTFFVDRYTGGAAVDFRIARELPAAASRPALLTLLNHDEFSSVEVRYGDRSIDSPYVPGALICGVGGLLSRLTAGRYTHARYRVVGDAAHPSMALPFSFGPRTDAVLGSVAAFDPRTAHWHPPAAAALQAGERI